MQADGRLVTPGSEARSGGPEFMELPFGVEFATLLPVFRFPAWGGSSVGRALRSQRRGREFESHSLHQFFRRRRFHSSLQPAGRKPSGYRYSVCPGSEQRIKRRETTLCNSLVGRSVRLGCVSQQLTTGVGLKQSTPQRGYQCLRRRHTKAHPSAARSPRPERFSPLAPAIDICQVASRVNVNAISEVCRHYRHRSRNASRNCLHPKPASETLTTI